MVKTLEFISVQTLFFLSLSEELALKSVTYQSLTVNIPEKYSMDTFENLETDKKLCFGNQLRCAASLPFLLEILIQL